jgi:hypothetical protein
MGNKQQGGDDHQTLEESQSSYSIETQSEGSTSPRKSRHFSMESVAAEISLDEDFIKTGTNSVNDLGVPTLEGKKKRRLTSTQFLGKKGDQAMANSPQRKQVRGSVVPQQVLNFERQSKSLEYYFNLLNFNHILFIIAPFDIYILCNHITFTHYEKFFSIFFFFL